MSVSGEHKGQAKVWTKEDVKAGLRKRGVSLRALARQHGKSAGYFSQVLITPLAFGEAIIADILEVTPQEIWPDRYGPDGLPLRGRFTPDRDVPVGAQQSQEVA